jgi:hypothetical protein
MILFLSASGLLAGAQADDDVYGIVESRPASDHAGDWLIGGRTLTATDQTKIEADDGPLAAGACASVDLKGDQVEEIESERPETCAPPPKPSAG